MSLEEVAGGPPQKEGGTVHVPVLLAECVEALNPKGKIIVDGTLGGAGHSREILKAGASVLISFDWDEAAVKAARAWWENEGQKQHPGQTWHIAHGSFSGMEETLHRLGLFQVDGILLDLGFSSDQLDNPERGLSYHAEGPLDMRLRTDSDTTAADILNTYGEKQLADMLYQYGEEPKSRALAKRMVETRKHTPYSTTGQLLHTVEEVYPAKFGQKRAHPAARIFQALRVAVNGELAAIEDTLPQATRLLTSGGTLAIITFQPLEDRMVKAFYRQTAEPRRDAQGRTLKDTPQWKAPGKIEPGDEELTRNPRSRSAKLRLLHRQT